MQDAKIGPDKDIPHVTPTVIVKYITDLQLLGLLYALACRTHPVDDVNDLVGDDFGAYSMMLWPVPLDIMFSVPNVAASRPFAWWIWAIVSFSGLPGSGGNLSELSTIAGTFGKGGAILIRAIASPSGGPSPRVRAAARVALQRGVLRGRPVQAGIPTRVDDHQARDKIRARPCEEIGNQTAVGVGNEDEWSRQLRRAYESDHVVDVLLHACGCGTSVDRSGPSGRVFGRS